MQLGASLPRNHSSDNFFRANRGSIKTSQSAKRSFQQGFDPLKKLKQTTPRDTTNASNFPHIQANQGELIAQLKHQVKRNFNIQVDNWDRETNAHTNGQFHVTDSFKSTTLKTHRRTQTLNNPINSPFHDQYTPRKTFLPSQASSRKEKISMDQFLFGAEPNINLTPFNKIPSTENLPPQIETFHFATSNHCNSLPTTTRNLDIATTYTPRPTTTQYECEGGVFKTSIGISASKSPKQMLTEIKRFG